MNHRCHRSTSGQHDFVKGAVADYCRFCWVIPRYERQEEPDRPSRPEPPEESKYAKVRVVSPPKGSARDTRLRTLIERDGLVCFYCQHELLDPFGQYRPAAQWWPTLDHLLSRSHGGTNDPTNLVLACKYCNMRKGDHVLLLVEVIGRLRAMLAESIQAEERAHAFIDQLQWELFDAGLGEIPGRTVLTKGKRRKVHRPRQGLRDTALHCELGERAFANLRAENVGGPHGRTAAVVKRGRIIKRREAVMG